MVTLTPDLIEEAARVQPDRTLATSFLEPDARAREIALSLFAHEIGRARAMVSEAGLAAIRLQWWRDVIEQVFSGTQVRAQPVAIALSATIKEANLPRLYLDAMIDAHEAEIDVVPFQTWAQVETYLDATQGNLNRLCLLASGVSAITTPIDTASRQAGIAWGFAGLLRALPQWCQRRATWLPSETLSGLDLEALYAGEVSPQLVTILRDVVVRVEVARRATNEALKVAQLGAHFPVLAPASLARRYAKTFVPAAGKPWVQPNDVSLLERQLRLTTCVATGRI